MEVMSKEKKEIPILGHSLRLIGKNWAELRLFAFYHRSIFEIMFLILYTLEQAALIFFVTENGINLEIVSYFALLVLLTFGLHKIMMESRLKIFEDEIIGLKNENDLIKFQSDEIFNSYKEVIEAYNQLEKQKK